MREACIIIGKNLNPEYAASFAKKADVVVGADQGAAYCIRHGIHLDYAVGDFDSVTAEEKEQILSQNLIVKTLPHHKDVTDTAYVVELFKEYDRITILGGIAGDRIEHFVANVDLLRARPNTLFLEDDDSWCVVLQNKTLEVLKKDYEYVSVFALEDATISLTGFEYPLSHQLLRAGDPLGVSNEMVEESGKIAVESGLLLVICHKRT